MKVCPACAALLLFSWPWAAAQSVLPSTAVPAILQQAAVSSAQAENYPAKHADIRRLLQLTGSAKIMRDTMDAATNSIRPLMINSLPPGEYREKLIDLFWEKFKSKADLEYLLDAASRVYEKHFSHEEIRALIKFYETPTGQKLASVMPQVISEMRQEGEKWGQKLGRESMQEVLTEHPEMVEAIQAASKPAPK